ncbi:ANKRD50 [Mytilus coruscus]|uniref:ANKRD50 n=1 Tax=Mytilus coruscus TaxID=42192 RepID=A0A6J8A9G2_MYTCO|nr:ANKRD50 [Mytilus coruscus]
METIIRHVDYQNFDNYITICLGLHLFTIGVYDFVVDKIKTEHNKLYTICASGTRTKRNCSKRFKMFKDWCQSCSKWKTELKKLKSDECRHWKIINWSQLSSLDWPQSIDEMAKVFVKNTSIHYRDGVFYDIGAVMSILTNMNIFAFDKITLKDIIRIRNDYYGHNYRTSIYDAEKNIFFEKLLHFIRLPTVCGYQSARKYTLALEELQNTEHLSQKLLKKLLDKNCLNNVRDVLLHNVQRYVSLEKAIVSQDEMTGNNKIYADFKSRLDKFIVLEEITEGRRKYFFEILTKFKIRNNHLFRLLLFTTLFVVLMRPTADQTGCMSMRFQHHWMSTIDFDFYIRELNSSSIIERVWLEPLLISALKTQTHVLLSAHLGYGKTTIVSQILCAEVYSPWHHLRTMAVAYHMCRFNHKDSILSDIFIRNLAGNIVKDVPELGNAILADVYAIDYLDFKCDKDTFSCLEIVIFAPLKHIQTDKKYLIITDALDECDTPMGNDLYDLLSKKLSDFPSFFQFLFTSRKIHRVLYEFKTLQNVMEIDLESYTERNILDAQRFIEITSNLTEEIKTNISCDLSKVHKTLENIYHINLKRILGTTSTTFDDWNALFEVLCAAANPIDLNELFLIAGLDDDKRRTFSILLGNELSHFLEHSNGKLSFQHKAFKEFLTKDSRKHMLFYTNETKGHKHFSNYYLHINTSQNQIDTKVLLDIAYHVALTYNKQIVNEFLQFYCARLKDCEILNIMARDVNCYDTANLVIHLINKSGLISSNMASAAFISSANGNHKTLRALLENNVYFKSKYNHVVEHTMKGAELVHMCKFVFFCGYSIFQIAAQRGYVEIVDYLLKKYPYMLYEQNSIRLNAFQLAAENGQTNIVKLFLDINSSLADPHSLYYASQQGHDEIVSLLLNYVNDTCLPCNGSMYWLLTLSIRKQIDVTLPVEALDTNSFYFRSLDIIQFDEMRRNIILLDDRRLLTCESALNAAVRKGHLRIVKLLLEEEVNALHCTMFDGSTSLMTAAKFDQAELFRYLHDYGGNLSCRCKNNLSYEDKIEKTELALLKEKKCPENGSLAHLLAIYNSYGIIKHLLNTGFYHWETNDTNGLTPSHYAFCCNSNNFIKLVVFADKDTAHLYLNSKSNNGSTPYHSAAVCRSLILSHYVDTSVKTLPDKVDNNNRSILHYGLMQPVSQEDTN